ncbi:ATP-binding protein [candidate division MSBL1 archaeon SCGC-AAA382K21]|uniref:ATP-binding protein n=1 Tax=candidate division MSBL1 archaeon SCGC-AAA382K21 TaxID=1698283 RepID=A0A133VJX9_9EURY|nr:ATP-binding protein [candidate division MSBL1 archaeon SCGC-AAA382K21]
MKVIEIENLTKYYGDTKGTENLSFEVEKGEIFGFLGPNGSGKTTTIKTMIKMLTDYDGEVEIFGKNLRDWGKDYYEKIGVSFEFPALYSKLTARENLDFFSSFYREETEDSSKILEIVDLGKDSGLTVGSFSKGMKTKLDIARALVNDPDLIFFDEPIAGLDPGSARKIKDLIFSKKEEGKTIFLTTHNMTVADELCDRVAFIVDGAVRLIDNPNKLKAERGKRRVKIEYEDDGKVDSSEFPLQDIGENQEFLHILKNNEIQRMKTLEPDLEEVFLQVTGEELR